VAIVVIVVYTSVSVRAARELGAFQNMTPNAGVAGIESAGPGSDQISQDATADFVMYSAWSGPGLDVRVVGVVFFSLCLYVAAAFLERRLVFRAAEKASKRIESEILPAIRADDFEAALEACRRMSASPLAELAEPVVLEMKSAGTATALSFERVRLASSRASLAVRARYRPQVRNLLSASVLAPMAGLLMATLEVSHTFSSDICGVVPRPPLGELASASFMVGASLFWGILAHMAYRSVSSRSSALETRIDLFEYDLLGAYLGRYQSRRRRKPKESLCAGLFAANEARRPKSKMTKRVLDYAAANHWSSASPVIGNRRAANKALIGNDSDRGQPG
jgi:hypothetical protein